MTFLDCLDDVLQHTATLAKTAANGFGSKTVVSTVSAKCFAFQGSSPRESGPNGYTWPFDWQVILPTDVRTIAQVDDKLLNIVDKDGVTVLSEGTIKEIASYQHWQDGPQFLVAILERQ